MHKSWRSTGVRATFIDAGHILGSASILLELEEQSHKTTVLFSGDLGNAGRVLLRSPATPPRSENVVMEATYGTDCTSNWVHPS